MTTYELRRFTLYRKPMSDKEITARKLSDCRFVHLNCDNPLDRLYAMTYNFRIFAEVLGMVREHGRLN